MNRVTLYSNWCYIDQLDGFELVDDEPVRIQWPAGAIEEHVVKVDKLSENDSDMGTPTQIPIRKAYIEIQHFGAAAKVYLNGMLAERINAPVSSRKLV